MGLWSTKSISVLMTETEQTDGPTLKRTLTATNLVLLGIGAIIGAGIFVLTGTAAAQYAGPGIVLSFVIAGFGCLFAGLCYAEFASMIPIAGSAYTYGYATLGEFVAWIIGWDLILEIRSPRPLSFSLVRLLHGVHDRRPRCRCRRLFDERSVSSTADSSRTTAIINLPAVLLIGSSRRCSWSASHLQSTTHCS